MTGWAHIAKSASKVGSFFGITTLKRRHNPEEVGGTHCLSLWLLLPFATTTCLWNVPRAFARYVEMLYQEAFNE
jgi:hypothetical protein